MQEIYWDMLLGTTSKRSEGSRTEHREKLGFNAMLSFNAVAIRALESSGSGMALGSYSIEARSQAVVLPFPHTQGLVSHWMPDSPLG